MTDGLVFEEKTHRYYLDDVRVPGTTSICAVIAKPGLLTWRGDVGNAEADRISKEAADFGKRVHKGCESIALNTSDEVWGFDEWECVKSYGTWFSVHVARVVLVETPVASRQHQMAGTPDIVAELKGEIAVRRATGKVERVDMTGETAVLDLKTSSWVDAGFGLQLEAYRRMVLEWLGIEATRRLVIHMPRKTPGKLEVVEFEREDELQDWRTFLSASIIWHRLFKEKAFSPKPLVSRPTPRPSGVS